MRIMVSVRCGVNIHNPSISGGSGPTSRRSVPRFHDPTPGEHLEALAAFRPLDNLEPDVPPRPQRPQPGGEVSGIHAICPDQPYAGELVPQHLQHALGPVAVLHTGGRDRYRQDQPERVDQNVAFAAFDLFMGVKAAEPPFSVVLTDWLSRIAALGGRRLPAATRTSPRSRSCITYQVPSFRHCQK
jgi:hypothetical protein